MKNKTYIQIKIVLLSIIAILLFGILIYFLTHQTNMWRWNFQAKTKIIYEENYSYEEVEQIVIEGSTTDVKIQTSSNPEIRVVVYGNKNEQATSQLDNHQLTVTKESKNQLCFGLCFTKDEIIVYIPADATIKIILQTSSGDVTFDAFRNIDLEVKTNSGDIEIEEISSIKASTTSGEVEIKSVKNAMIETSTGDIEISNLYEFADLHTNSGDIEIQKFIIGRTSSIYTQSGDLSIAHLTDAYIDVKTSSGDVHIKENNRFADVELKIETSSGDITVR